MTGRVPWSRLVGLARWAPSGFNRQPWVCFPRQAELVVRERTDLAPSRFDPGGQATAISLAGFVHHLAVAARLQGVGLEPGPARGGPPLEMALRPARPIPAAPAAPAAVLRRRTHREPYRAAQVAPGTLKRWEALAARQEVGLEAARPSPGLAEDLARFEALTLRCAAIRSEVLAGLARGRADATGIPVGALRLGPVSRVGFAAALAAPRNEVVWRAAARLWGRVARGRLASAALLVSFSLPGAAALPEGYFRLGFALNEVWLDLQRLGLVACPVFSFAFPRLCPGCYTDRPCPGPGGDWWRGHFSARPEIVLRVGCPTRPPVPPPRRTVADIVRDAPCS